MAELGPVTNPCAEIPLLGGGPVATGITIEQMKMVIAKMKDFGKIADKVSGVAPLSTEQAIAKGEALEIKFPPIGEFPLTIEVDTGTTWAEVIENKKPNKKIPVAEWTQQAQHFMKNTVKIDSMSVNGHQLEILLVAFAEKMNAELMTRMEQMVQDRLDGELLKQTKKVSSTFKKNSRKFRPDEG